MATRERFRGGGPHEASEADTRRTIRVTVNGEATSATWTSGARWVDFIREDLRLTGLHCGCEHGVCGACTVLFDGNAVRSCLMLAVQVHGRNLKTIEGVASPDGELSPIQQAFWDNHGAPVRLLHAGHGPRHRDFLRDDPSPTRDEVREGMSGNICRCTGYQLIVDSILDAAEALRNGETGGTDAGAS